MKFKDIVTYAKLVKNLDHNVTSTSLDSNGKAFYSETRGKCFVISPSSRVCNKIYLNLHDINISFLCLVKIQRIPIFVYLHNLQLSPYDSIVLRIKRSSDIEVLFISSGEEIFSTVDLWPYFPPSIRLKKNVETVDVLLKKSIHIQGKDTCTGDENYQYSGRNICSQIIFKSLPTNYPNNEVINGYNQITKISSNFYLYCK